MYIVRVSRKESETSKLKSDNFPPYFNNSQTLYLDSPQKLQEIVSQGFQIDSIHKNRFFTVPHSELSLASSVKREANWGADYLSIQKFWELKARGQSVKVGIADTGIFLDHDCFASLDLKEFIDINIYNSEVSSPKPYDSEGHGTHCAGILCGLESDGMSRGVSPDIELYFAKCFDNYSSSSACLNKALEWFHEKQCDIVSLSLGDPGLNDDYAEAMFKLTQGGALVFVASGNEYLSKQQPHTRAPANYPLEGLISVGASTKREDVWEASSGGIIDWPDDTLFSGKKNILVPYLVAPGEGIVSCAPEKGTYRNDSGTSMATPHVAGIAANILSFIRMSGIADEKNLTKQIINNALIDSGQIGNDERYGKGLLSADKILSQLHALTA